MPANTLQLYDYFRSSASYRVRIALNIKNINYDKIPIHLVNNGGEQHSKAYQHINPQQLVPSLAQGGMTLTQSLAIIEWLEDCFPTPALLPADPILRCHTRAIAQMVASDIHPLLNLRVQQYLQNDYGFTDAQKQQWYQHWIHVGFTHIEAMLQRTPRSTSVCVGDDVSLADCCLIPQVYNARRFNCPLDNFPLIVAIDEHCQTLTAFKEAAPVST